MNQTLTIKIHEHTGNKTRKSLKLTTFNLDPQFMRFIHLLTVFRKFVLSHAPTLEKKTIGSTQNYHFHFIGISKSILKFDVVSRVHDTVMFSFFSQDIETCQRLD